MDDYKGLSLRLLHGSVSLRLLHGSVSLCL
jgi:hypothetical protein